MQNTKTVSMIATLALSCLVLAGCDTLGELKKELYKGGFDLWYPAEEGVQPGEIWVIEGNVKTRGFRRPDALEQQSAELKFDKLTKNVDASISLNADFAAATLGKAGDLKSTFDAGTVKNVSLDFGQSKAYRITFGDLLDPKITAKFPTEYRAALESVKTKQKGYIVLAAVVYTSGLTYNLEVTNKSAFEAKTQGEVEKLLGAGITIKWDSDTKVSLTIPDGRALAIGFAPLNPDLLARGFAATKAKLSDADLIRAIAAPISRL